MKIAEIKSMNMSQLLKQIQAHEVSYNHTWHIVSKRALREEIDLMYAEFCRQNNAEIAALDSGLTRLEQLHP